jgi:ribosome recycling factor
MVSCTREKGDATVTHEIRKRIVRDATAEEKERHRAIRQEIKEELPELKRWAKDSAARHQERVVVGTVFTDQEAAVLEAIDDYATKHALSSRGAVVREALAHLLGIEMPRQ